MTGLVSGREMHDALSSISSTIRKGSSGGGRDREVEGRKGRGEAGKAQRPQDLPNTIPPENDDFYQLLGNVPINIRKPKSSVLILQN